MASLGQELKRERELRGISLEEIATTTKISLRFLQALENDHLEVLPGKFFIKGILRAYAKSLGLEEEYVLNKYYEDSLLKEQALEKELKEEKNRKKSSQKRFNFFNIIFISVLLLLIFLSFYFISRSPKNSTPLQETQAPATFQEEAAVPLPEPRPVSLPETEEVEELNLEISFLEDTWIQVYADGELTSIDGVKKPGEEVSIKAQKELILHLGNAGGISYYLNGKKGKSLGSAGAVVKNIKITLDNYDQFLLQGEEEKTE